MMRTGSPLGVSSPLMQTHFASPQQPRPAALRFPDLQVRAIQPGGQSGVSQFDAKDMRSRIEPPLQLPVAGPWQAPSVDELKKALATEPTFATAIAAEGPAGEAWVSKLAQAIDRAMPSEQTDPGVGMIFRFEAAYGGGRVSHIAIGTAWRAPEGDSQAAKGDLKVAFLHQESLPDLGKNEGDKRPGTFTGAFFPTFDTAAIHPDRVAPVAESMKTAGLPDVNVVPFPLPQTLPQIGQVLSTLIGDHAYGPSRTWPGVQDALASGQTAFLTCFDVTDVAVQALSGQPLVYPKEHSTDQAFERLADLACINLNETAEVKVGRDMVPRNQLFADGQSTTVQQIGFLTLGQSWGRSADWQVPSTGTTSSAQFTLKPGEPLTQQGGLPENWSGLQFSAVPKGVKLDGLEVRTGKHYGPEECARMQVTEPGKARVVVGERTNLSKL
jgi:hypothetical protein